MGDSFAQKYLVEAEGEAEKKIGARKAIAVETVTEAIEMVHTVEWEIEIERAIEEDKIN